MAEELEIINGVGPALAKRLARKGFATVPKVAGASAKALSEVQGLSEETARKVIADAKRAKAPAKKTPAKKAAAKKAPAKKKPKSAKPAAPSAARIAKLEKQLVEARSEAKKATKRARKNAKAIAKLKKQLKKKKNK